ncbi:MAG: CHRD domain-containing protein [Steroidobacteraceae bacterium]
MSERSNPIRLVLAAAMLLSLLPGCGGGGGGDDNPPPPPAPAPPTITLAAPTSGTATANRTVSLSANATAGAGITRVEFLVDGAVVGTANTAPYSFAWDTSAVSNGPHTLTARVTDMANTVVTSAPVTVTVNNNPTIAVVLSPAETFPRPASTASGSGDLAFNLINGAVSGGVTVSGITATMAHIHQGFAGANGDIVVNFVQSGSDPSRWDAAAGSMLTTAQIDDLLAGGLYVNVHSSGFPLGEIRAQIQPENIEVVFTAMTANAVVPPVTITADGVAATTIDSNAGNATVHANTTGIDDATQAHVHKAAAGANNATSLFALTKDPATPGRWSAERQAVTAADRTDFGNNGWYIDVHTPANPAGAIRGQFTPDPAPPPPSTTLAQLQSTIFTPRCSGCHSGAGNALPGSMNLSSAAGSFAALVNVSSEEQPAVLRVRPNNPDSSYLVRKLEGAAGISGGRMPLGGPFLDQATIDQVRSWITAGAANN